MELKNKNAIITGGGGAIGSEIARRFIEEGACVIIADNNKAALDHVYNKFGGYGNIFAKLVDVSDESSVSKLINFAEKQFSGGKIDILANVAGIGPFKKFIDTSTESFQSVMDINLKGTFLTSRMVSKKMISTGGGSIINMSSTNGILAEEGLASYNTSKAAIILLSKTIALELGKYNIRANSVCPGWIRTELQDKAGLPKEVIDNYIKKIPLGRAGTTSDVADLFVFLASERSSFITGTEIVIDGGQICQE
jgi:3-oxoacyl-[acyl-carrier protein] reductase